MNKPNIPAGPWKAHFLKINQHGEYVYTIEMQGGAFDVTIPKSYENAEQIADALASLPHLAGELERLLRESLDPHGNDYANVKAALLKAGYTD
jgi:hypothetical protein